MISIKECNTRKTNNVNLKRKDSSQKAWWGYRRKQRSETTAGISCYSKRRGGATMSAKCSQRWVKRFQGAEKGCKAARKGVWAHLQEYRGDKEGKKCCWKDSIDEDTKPSSKIEIDGAVRFQDKSRSNVQPGYAGPAIVIDILLQLWVVDWYRHEGWWNDKYIKTTSTSISLLVHFSFKDQRSSKTSCGDTPHCFHKNQCRCVALMVMLMRISYWQSWKPLQQVAASGRWTTVLSYFIKHYTENLTQRSGFSKDCEDPLSSRPSVLHDSNSHSAFKN